VAFKLLHALRLRIISRKAAKEKVKMSRENQKCCSIYNTQPLQDIDIWKNFKIHVKVSYNFRNCLKDFFDLVDVHIPQELLIRLKIRQAKFFLSNGIKAIKIKITKNNLFWKGNFFF
jgi:hypothetical protein